MRKISARNASLLGLVLMAASTATAAIIPDKSNIRRANNGTLRIGSATLPGVDQDRPLEISCIPEIETSQSCTATDPSETTTNFFINESILQIGPFNYHTQGNTSQTAAQAGDQNSILVAI